jgi:hypothetical protein
MTTRTLCILALLSFSSACTARSPRENPTPVPLGSPALQFPSIDAATLTALNRQLERITQDTALLSALNPSHPRFYALFRDLEAAQEGFAIALATPDSTGRTLYDRLAALAAHADSVFRSLEERNRRAPRP